MGFLNNEWLDLLFENRHKAYGAFQIRSNYNSVLAKSILSTTLLCLFLLGGYFIKKGIGNTEEKREIITELDISQLSEAPKIETPPPPPPPSSTVVPVTKPQVKFVIPVVKEDKEVQDETPPPKEEEFKDADPSTETKEGDPNSKVSAISDAPLGKDSVVAPPASAKPIVVNENKVFTFSEIMPEFDGGRAALTAYISKNLRYPAIAMENNITGVVAIEFIVGKDGNLSDFKIVKDLAGGCGNEALRIVKAMPKWKPGIQQGQPVTVKFTIPIRFNLEKK